MNSETSEGEEKRVHNLEAETVVSPLGPNLFMYAGSFLAGFQPFLYLLCRKARIIHYHGSVITDQLSLSWMVSHTHFNTLWNIEDYLAQETCCMVQCTIHCCLSAPIP